MNANSTKDSFTSLWYYSCKHLFSFFCIASNSFFESGSRVAVVGAVAVCMERANSDGTWWYASWTCENYGVYSGCGRPRLELPFVVNMYWFALNWGGFTSIGDCISKFLQGDEFGLISSNSSMFGRYLVVQESPLRDSMKSPLRGGKGEWSVTMKLSIPVRDCNMLVASWVTVTLKMQEM
jgi:hypothetical protein